MEKAHLFIYAFVFHLIIIHRLWWKQGPEDLKKYFIVVHINPPTPCYLELKINFMEFYKMVCQANENVLHTKKKGGGESFWLSHFASEISSIFHISIEIEGKVFYEHAKAFQLLTVITCDSTHVKLPANALHSRCVYRFMCYSLSEI